MIGSLRRAAIALSPYPGTVRASVLTYRGAHGFDLAPDRLWQQIEAMDQFEGWWPWLTDFWIDG